MVVIDCQRAGPSTGVPTKTEQGDLWQMLGAAFGDYPRVIAAPLDIGDCFTLIPEIFNVADKFQCPGIVLCDLLLAEGRLSVDPKVLDFYPEVDRGELITSNGVGEHEPYKRYKITESGVSPRVIPGVPGHTHVVSSDEHDEDGVLISDEYTNCDQAPRDDGKAHAQGGWASRLLCLRRSLLGPADAEVTLIGWGSTYGVIDEACELLRDEGISANHLPIRWLVPLHGDAIMELLKGARSARSSSRTISAGSLRGICAARRALSPMGTFASTTASRLCRTTLWRRSRNSLRAGRSCLFRRMR